MRRSAIQLACLAILAAAAAAGCGSRTARYTPAPAAARASLEAALAEWRAGRSPGAIQQSPLVQVVDTGRQPGQTLRSFEVLGESSVRGEGRCFIVGLALENPAAQVRARYVVVGIDPIWVFRKEDYDKLAHWEHPMEIAEPADAENSSAADRRPETTTTTTTTINERS